MTFADRLRELREAAGLTQAALADAARLSMGAVRNYEQGIREPNWEAVFRLAEALGVECSAFKDCVGASRAAPSEKRPGKADAGHAKAPPARKSRNRRG